MVGEDIEVRLGTFLRKIANEQGFKDYKLQITPVSSDGANYSSTLYKAKIEDNHNVLNLFAKVAIISDEVLEELGISADKSIFETENFFYGNVAKIFREIEEKYKVPEEDRYILPKYYGAITEKSKEILVLEDLNTKGFIIYDRLKSVDWSYASSAVKELTKFHALFMAFKKEYPDIYNKFIEKYEFEAYKKYNLFESLFVKNFKTCAGIAKEENKERVKKFFDNITFGEFSKLYEPGKFKTVIHADFRPSNIMHIYREDGTAQVILIDYQTLQEGCPVSDLLYFVFMGSDEEFRRHYFDQLMDHYHTELSAAMIRLGIDNSGYSRAEFEQELKEKLKYGLIIAACWLPVVTVEPHEAPKFTEGASKVAEIKTSATLVSRVNGIVNDYIRWGIL